MKRLKRLIIRILAALLVFLAVFTVKLLYTQSPTESVSYIDSNSESEKINNFPSDKNSEFLNLVKSFLNDETQPIKIELLMGEKIDSVPKGYLQEKDWRHFVDSLYIEKLDIAIAKKIYSYVSNTVFYKREKEEAWQMSEETFSKKAGDCEDYAIEFYDLCVAKNLKVRVAIGEVRSGNRWLTHGFNLLYINNKVYLVDCASGVFDKIENVISNYKIKYTFDKSHIYRHSELKNLAKRVKPTKEKSTVSSVRLLVILGKK